ncbi:MAG: MlaD family protein [Leeuwenhoekiella sp.]
MKFSKEIKTGLLAVVAIVLLIFGYSFLKGENLLKNDRTFYAVYDNVEGLAPSSSVTINGLKVGKVLSIQFLNNSGDLLVTFDVENEFRFSKNSTAQIYGGGLIGGKNLEILPEYDENNLAISGDTLPSSKDEGIFELVNDRLTPLQKKVEAVIVDADSVLTAVTDVLDKDTRANLRTSIADISETATNFKNASASLNELLSDNQGKFNRTFTNLDKMSANFVQVSDSLTQVDFKRIINQMEAVVADFQAIAEGLENGEGTAGKLLKDDAVYVNLERATEQMQELLQDIKLNPKRYVHFSVFGKKGDEYEEPEDPNK